MSIDIRRALREGLNRSLKRNSAVLFVVFLVFGAVSTVAAQSVLATLLPQLVEFLQEASQRPLPSLYTELLKRPHPLAVSIPVGGAIALFCGMVVLGQTARILSDRTFISDESEQLYEPGRWIIPATLSSVAGVIIIVGLFTLLYIPIGILRVISPLLALLWTLIAVVVTIVLVISFYFFRQEIASEDVGPIDALTNSWSLVSGDRLKILVLAVLLYLISFVVSGLGSTLFSQFNLKVRAVASIVIVAALVVFDSAVVAQVYRQLRAEDQAADGIGADAEDTDEDEWEPDEKWNDPPL